MKTSTRRISPVAGCLCLFFLAPSHLPVSALSSSSIRTGRGLQFEGDDQDDFDPSTTIIQTIATPAHPPLNDASLRDAVHTWVTNSNETEVAAKYGPISQWNTTAVTDMSHLFTNARFFDEDLSRWDTSRVTTMSYMFAFCSSFTNRGVGLENWDTSQVTDMSFAFHQATQFDGAGLEHWNVHKVRDLTYFAQGATLFNPSLWQWQVGNVRTFNRAFHNATNFDQQLCWNLNPHASVVQTFCGTKGAAFACDPHNTLQSSVNLDFHQCCDCDYNANQHYYGYHLDDDGYWQEVGGDDADINNHKMGVILASVIWAMVFIMIVLVVVVTLRRRHEFRQWFEDKLQSTASANSSRTQELAPDGSVIATFVGPAAEITIPNFNNSAPPSSSNASTITTTTPTTTTNDQNIPMVLVTTSTPSITEAQASPAWFPADHSILTVDMIYATGGPPPPPPPRRVREEDYET